MFLNPRDLGTFIINSEFSAKKLLKLQRTQWILLDYEWYLGFEETYAKYICTKWNCMSFKYVV